MWGGEAEVGIIIVFNSWRNKYHLPPPHSWCNLLSEPQCMSTTQAAVMCCHLSVYCPLSVTHWLKAKKWHFFCLFLYSCFSPSLSREACFSHQHTKAQKVMRWHESCVTSMCVSMWGRHISILWKLQVINILQLLSDGYQWEGNMKLAWVHLSCGRCPS